MPAPKPPAGAPSLAALETLFGPPQAEQDRPRDDAKPSQPEAIQTDVPVDRTNNGLASKASGPEMPPKERVWTTMRQADRAQRSEARVTVTISVTVAQRRKLKQMALDRDTTIQQLLEPSILAVLRKADER